MSTLYNIYEKAFNCLNDFRNDLQNQNVVWCALDTETTGLHIIKDKPFLFIFGWSTSNGDIKVYTLDLEKVEGFELTRLILKEVADTKVWCFAHNTKYDMHMLANIGLDTYFSEIRWADTMAIARLTMDADDNGRLALKALATRYIDVHADDYEKNVKKELTSLKKINNKQLDALLEGYNITAKEAREKIERCEEVDDEVIELLNMYQEPNYSNVNRELLTKYACCDVEYVLKYVILAMDTVYKREQQNIMLEEFDLIYPLWKQERTGLRINVQYLEESKVRVEEYLNRLKKEFIELAGRPCETGQHALIKEIFRDMGYVVPSVNKDVLPSLIETTFEGKAKRFAEVLLSLRTVEKWYSTYILRFLNSVVDGKIYTSFNQFGAVSGRLSSDFQQFPKAPLKDDEGNELFHPRKLVIPSGNGYNKLFMLDFSQMELRCQAHYTILTSGGDHNLCNAYMPFGVDEKDWKPTDLHTATAINAFGEDCVNRPDFKQLRNASKTTNFAVIYGASTDKLCTIPALSKFSYEEVDRMRNAFYTTFPKIMDYKRAISKTLVTHGYVKNAFGRRYYSSNKGYAHKICNYVIQGSCADMVKNAMINVDEFLTKNKLRTRVVLSVHDELFYEVYDGEEWCIPVLQKIQQKATWCKVPMVSEIMYTDTNWAEKKDWKG